MALERGKGDLEQHADGSVAVFVAEEPAWHRLGEFREAPESLEVALDLGKLRNWNVRKVPFFGQRDDRSGMAGRTIELPDQFMTIRDNPITGEPEGLGTVGPIWTPFQNEEVAEGCQVIIDEGGANIHTAGSIRGGRLVFISVKLPEAIMVGGEDQVDLYIVGATAHDGSMSNKFSIRMVRPVCANTFTEGAKSAKSSWSFRHTTGFEGKAQDAREGLQLTWKFAKATNKVFDGMISSPFSDEEMEGFLKDLMPDPKSEKEGWVQRAEGERLAVMNIFKNKETCEIGRGTRWAAWNAVTEYADWFRPGSEERRAKEALGLGVNVQLKPKAFKMLSAGVR
jgi:phage/plasmid-like protein (TIGR03299 family)